jgi:pimeloyl-ACP methyl ester carboxylesterase
MSTAGRIGGSSPLAIRALAAAAVAALAVAGCSSGGSPGHPGHASHSSTPAVASPQGQSLHWHSCSQPAAGGLLCATLQVPVNYAKPDGRKISLALSEKRATAPKAQQQGYLLVNPGGPGGPGVAMAAMVAQGLSPSVAADYNIIGFDTRGVGASVPALHCDPSYFAAGRPNYIPGSNAAEQVWISRARSYAADCERKYGWLLPYMTTRDLASDLDSIRVALGAQQISYFAYSYGTYLGQVYATMFPNRVRRMVLDSTVDPAGVWWQDNIDQDYAFQKRQAAFYAWAAGYDRDYHLGSTAAQVRASFYQARNKLVAHPVQGASGPALGPDELDDTFLVGGYNNGYWPLLAGALSQYLKTGSAGQLTQLYAEAGQQAENEFAVYNAVECSDAAWPRNWSAWNTATRKVYATAPYEAWDNAWFNAACAFWPVRGPAQPMKIGAAGLPPILMLQGTLDAATPYAGALVARRDLPTARMVVVEGGGNHGQSLADPPNACVNGYLNRYLATGALPSGSGLVSATCAALPPPGPGG